MKHSPKHNYTQLGIIGGLIALAYWIAPRYARGGEISLPRYGGSSLELPRLISSSSSKPPSPIVSVASNRMEQWAKELYAQELHRYLSMGYPPTMAILEANKEYAMAVALVRNMPDHTFVR